jgi:hypothetical protein
VCGGGGAGRGRAFAIFVARPTLHTYMHTLKKVAVWWGGGEGGGNTD